MSKPTYLLPQELADQIFQYLATRPFIEVEAIIVEMRKMAHLKESKIKDAKPEDKISG